MAQSEFELQGNTLYYLVDLGLKPPQAIVDAINDKDAKVEVTAESVTTRTGFFGPRRFVHAQPQPEMMDTTDYRFDYKVTSDHAAGKTDFTFNPAALMKDPKLEQHPEMRALATGAHPKWQSADEAVQFISNLIDKDPLILVGTKAGNQIAERMRSQLDETPFNPNIKQTPDGIIDAREQQIKEWAGHLREELRKQAPQLKAEVLEQVRDNFDHPRVAPAAPSLVQDKPGATPEQMLANLVKNLPAHRPALKEVLPPAEAQLDYTALRSFGGVPSVEVVQKGQGIIGEKDVNVGNANPVPGIVVSSDIAALAQDKPEIMRAAIAYGMAAKVFPEKQGETVEQKQARLSQLDNLAYAIDPDKKGIAELLDAAAAAKPAGITGGETVKAPQIQADLQTNAAERKAHIEGRQ